MSAVYPSLSERRRADSIARNFTREAVSGRRAEAQRFLAAGLEMIDRGSDCGADPAFLLDIAKGLHDALVNLVTGMRRDLDNVGAAQDWRPIGLTDLAVLIEKMEGRSLSDLSAIAKEVG